MKSWNGEQECRGQTSAFYMHNVLQCLGMAKRRATPNSVFRGSSGARDGTLGLSHARHVPRSTPQLHARTLIKMFSLLMENSSSPGQQ